ELPLQVKHSVYRGATPLGGRFDDETNEVVLYGEQGVYRDGTARLSRPAGAVVRVLTTAGGGWGDPWERDPELVKRDGRDEDVTSEGAARQYGVVVVGNARQPEQLQIDVDATNALRAHGRGPG